MQKSVITKDLLPFAFWLILLFLLTLLLDYFLHQIQLVWIGKYLGIPGILIFLLSFMYSLRKRKVIQSGSPKRFLKLHQYMAWFGTMLILVHAGIHFNGLLPWTALIMMLFVFISGLIGQYILKNARRTLKNRYAYLSDQGYTEEAVERKVFIDALAVQAMTQWRLFHKPITMIFAALAALHIITIFMFWSWWQ